MITGKKAYNPFLIFILLLICRNSLAQMVINNGAPIDMGEKQMPPPGEGRIRTRDAFTMTTVDLETKTGDPVFMLKFDEKTSLGPFTYKEGGTVGSKKNSYVIVKDFDDSFKLKSKRNSKVFGPFKFANGEKITIDSSSFEISIEHAFIWGAMSHSGALSKNNTIYLLQMTTNFYNGMADLRYKLIALHNKHEYYIAPRQLKTPEIRTITGHKHSNIIKRSKADIAKDSRSTDTQARSYFTKFCKDNIYKTAKPNYKGMYTFGKLKPGRYMVCCETTKRNDDGDKLIRSRPTFWWTGLSLQAGDSVMLNLSEKNDLDWRDLFVKDHSKDEF